MLLEDVGDFPIRVALAAKLPDEVAVGLQARAHRVIGSGFEEVFSLLIHVGFLELVSKWDPGKGWTLPGRKVDKSRTMTASVRVWSGVGPDVVRAVSPEAKQLSRGLRDGVSS